MEYKNRVLTVDGLIVNDRNQILLIKRGRDPYKNFWALPGGYMDWNETAEEAVKREVKEETGLDVISAEYLGLYDSPERHPEQRVAVAYITSVIGNPKAGDDAVEFKWFSFTELPDKLAFDHGKMINDYLNLSRIA